MAECPPSHTAALLGAGDDSVVAWVGRYELLTLSVDAGDVLRAASEGVTCRFGYTLRR